MVEDGKQREVSVTSGERDAVSTSSRVVEKHDGSRAVPAESLHSHVHVTERGVDGSHFPVLARDRRALGGAVPLGHRT